MSGRRLVLVRHGRTAHNHEGRVQGQTDVDLDDAGRAQAARTAPVIAALAPSLLWTSDLARTRQTAGPIAEATGLTARPDPRLREFSFGVREGLSHAEYAEVDPEGLAALRSGRYDDVEEAEPTEQVRARTTEALRELLDSLGEGQTGVAVSHGGALRVAVAALLGWPDDQLHSLAGLSNCGWAVLVEPRHETDPTGRLRLEAYHRVVAPSSTDPDFVPVATGG